MELNFEPLSIKYETQTKALIIKGLKSHWGEYIDAYNPDIIDLFDFYENRMIIGLVESKVAACGAWKVISRNTVEFVRFSVAADFQRLSIGSSLISHVETCVLQLGYKEIILETISTWDYVIQFYRRNGYQVTHKNGPDTYFSKTLDS